MHTAHTGGGGGAGGEGITELTNKTESRQSWRPDIVDVNDTPEPDECSWTALMELHKVVSKAIYTLPDAATPFKFMAC